MSKVIKLFKKDTVYKDTKKIKISCLGDSITNGICSNLNPSDYLNEKGSYKQYYRQFEDVFWAETVNCGQNGSFVAKYDVKKNNSASFVERYTDIPKDSDIITILGGVNDCLSDYYSKEEFGSPDDFSNTEINTFCGALRTILSELKKNFPDSLIIYLTPLKYSSVADNQGAKWENNQNLHFYIDAIIKICTDFNIPYIDLYSPPELDFCHMTEDMSIYGDRLHFGPEGHRRLGKFIIDKLIKDGLIKICD